MQSDPRRKTTPMAAVMGLMHAATALGSCVPVPQSRTRRIAVVEKDDPPEVQKATIAAAEAKRARRAARNRKSKEQRHE